jgi:hypothetical protein
VIPNQKELTMLQSLKSAVTRGACGLVVAAISVTSALGGPVTDFEMALRAAYGDYRGALFQTNAKKPEESARATASFLAKWNALGAAVRAAPPPQYVDDPALADTLGAVSRIAMTAADEIAAGKLTEAHETLEAIRDQISALHARNGVIGFSDRMNAYHAKMEAILGANYQGFESDGLGRLREDAAVLSYLAADIFAHPAPEAADPAYASLIGALKASVDALVAASRAGDAAAAKSAVDGLKVPYAKLFLKFG